MYATCYCFVYYPLILLSLLFIAGHNCYGSESNGLHWFDTRHWPTHRANQNTEQRLCWQSENFPSWWFFIPFKIPCFYVCNLTVVHLQIYVEIERARLIKRLAKIKEEQGQIDEAADLMQEVAVSLHCTRIEDMYFHIMWQCFCHSLVLYIVCFIRDANLQRKISLASERLSFNVLDRIIVAVAGLLHIWIFVEQRFSDLDLLPPFR